MVHSPGNIVRDATDVRATRVRSRFVAVAVLVCAGIALPNAIEPSEATWADSEAVSGSLSAATIPAPELASACRYNPGVLGLGARVEIFWRLPAGVQLSAVVAEASTSGLGSVLAPLTGFSLTSNTTSTGNGIYRTEVPTNLLGGLLGLGTELEIALSVVDPSGWRSEAAAVATNAGLIAGLGGSCRNLT